MAGGGAFYQTLAKAPEIRELLLSSACPKDQAAKKIAFKHTCAKRHTRQHGALENRHYLGCAVLK